MDQLNILYSSSGNSLIHQFDGRLKMIVFLSFNILILQFKSLNLAILSLLIIFLFVISKISIASIFKESRYIVFLFILVFFGRVFNTPGEPFFETSFFFITWEGIESGTIVTWRLILIVYLGVLFVQTTPPFIVKTSLEWFLKPLPGVPEQRISLMIALMIRFLPMILEQANEIRNAQLARGIQNRRNPLFKTISLTIPLFKKIFEQADQLILAMESRSYSEKRTNPMLKTSTNDWILFVLAVILISSLWIIKG